MKKVVLIALFFVALTACVAPPQLSSSDPGEIGSGVEVSVSVKPGVGDGMWLIGQDLPAGTYRSAGPTESVVPNCYWERLSDASGSFESILANGNASGPVSVTVSAGEYFQSNGCMPWVLV
jgi:hypothetical protein